jgi:cyclic pyranopterin phosphate synthase
MEDQFNRTINYLRLSITNNCNLRCIYCIPEEDKRQGSRTDILDFDDLFLIAKLAVELGVKKIRITGGEPLTRTGVVDFIAQLRKIDKLEDLSLTTNGVLLQKFAQSLALAGLNRVNVSLDSLNPDKYKEITRGGSLSQVLQGIEKAENAGLVPIKINNVPIRGFNDSEIETFAKLTLTKPYHIRFIELMPIGARNFWHYKKFIPVNELIDRLSKISPLKPVFSSEDGPAQNYKFDNGLGTIGFISAVTHDFCGKCNRLRITYDGKIRPCLFSDKEIDLRPSLSSMDRENEVSKIIKSAILSKPLRHKSFIHEEPDKLQRPMKEIGG